MRKTRFLLFVLTFMMFGVINAEIASGTCGKNGNNITWVLDDDGTLTLSGSGEMEHYGYNSFPWYSNREKITKVAISEGITSIENFAFCGCSGLTSVTIPNSVTSIGESAFEGCRGLTSVTIPNSVTSIGSYAFDGCRGLVSVNIVDIEAWCNIKFIKDLSNATSNPLHYASKLLLNGEEIKELVIPNSVTIIGDETFLSCNNFTSVIIPNSVTSIGYSAFAGCGGLTSVTIPTSVTSIGNAAFSGCI